MAERGGNGKLNCASASLRAYSKEDYMVNKKDHQRYTDDLLSVGVHGFEPRTLPTRMFSSKTSASGCSEQLSYSPLIKF